MSNFPESSGSERFSGGRKLGKAPEKSSFAHTCNLLSQYLKENRNVGGLSFGIAGKLQAKGLSETFRPTTTTLDLLPNMGKASELPVPNIQKSSEISVPFMKSMDSLPQYVDYRSFEDLAAHKKAGLSKTAKGEPESAQMTIFYAGKVLVYDDFPANKAKEIMLLAGKGNPQNPSSVGAPNSGTSHIQEAMKPQPQLPPQPQAQPQAQPQPRAITVSSGLPIARRASLHRFLDKRKGRASAAAPYQVNEHPEAPSNPEEGSSSSKQLDLNLY